jgi:hypothetical protein
MPESADNSWPFLQKHGRPDVFQVMMLLCADARHPHGRSLFELSNSLEKSHINWNVAEFRTMAIINLHE